MRCSRVPWSGVGWTERIVARKGGSVPQPLQELPSVNPAEGSGRPIVGAEVIPQTVDLGSVGSLNPEDGPVVGVGDGGDLSGEAGVGHRGCL